MKIIFLDIDGVLNSYQEWVPVAERMKSDLVWDLHDLTPKYIERLNEIIEKTDAKIVISSSWRLQYSPHEIEDMLIFRGFKGSVIDEIPLIAESGWMEQKPRLEKIELNGVINADRGDEIQYWLNHNQVSNFIILDDIDYDNVIKYFYSHFIHIKKGTGILPQHVEKACRKLNIEKSC